MVTLAQMKARQQQIEEAREEMIQKKLSSFGEPDEVARKKKKKKQAKVSGSRYIMTTTLTSMEPHAFTCMHAWAPPALVKETTDSRKIMQ